MGVSRNFSKGGRTKARNLGTPEAEAIGQISVQVLSFFCGKFIVFNGERQSPHMCTINVWGCDRKLGVN